MASIHSETLPVLLNGTRPEDTTLPAFMVSTARGFLPRMDPITALPSEFAPLEALLTAMPVRTASGEQGLLALGTLGDAVKDDLPDLTEAVEKYAADLPLMNALYRDYSFLASAYLLEPCHLRFLRGEEYGLGRSVLPRQLSRPIARCAEISGFKPFMEYAGSYALFNYRLEDPGKGLDDYDNLRLIRAFEHGLDPSSSEAGFVLVHVDMVRNSGPLVAGTVACLDAISPPSSAPASPKMGSGDGKEGLTTFSQRQSFNAGLSQILAAMRRVNGTMETMWSKSRPRSYTSFRTFIFGITSQSMFPDGVVYESLYNEEPQSFRGESGANDSMIPLLDNLLQVPMPDTPLTAILNDFRDYRPSNHRQFLVGVKQRAAELGVKAYALETGAGEEGREEEEDRKVSRKLFLQVLDQVRDFRWRHWCFAREYILKQTAHPTATGGSPIVTWLPNQLQAVLDEMASVYEGAGGRCENGNSEDTQKQKQKEASSSPLGPECRDIMDLVYRQRDTLRKEVDKYCQERGVSRS